VLVGGLALLGAAAAGLIHCSDVTELVVVVDTDLTPTTDFDHVEVRVEGPRFVAEKEATVGAATSLPLTLGVAAGDDPSADVTVVATALKAGVEVARTRARAKMSPGTSRVLQVSLCRACGLTCDVSYGDGLPTWTGAAPATNACQTALFIDAGSEAGLPLDGGSPGEGGSLDGGGGGDACACPAGSRCGSGRCLVEGNPGCQSPIVIPDLDGGKLTLQGTLCPGGESLNYQGCQGQTFRESHVIELGGSGSRTVDFRAVGGDIIMMGFSSTCSGPSGCTKVFGGGGAVRQSHPSGLKLGVGLLDASECGDYTLDFQ
jgi:hypothetical protein